MIQEELDLQMLAIQGWRLGEGDEPEALLKGRWVVIEEDEDAGLFGGDEGTVTASVVGSPKYGNERVFLGFTADGTESPVECRLFENVDVLSADA